MGTLLFVYVGHQITILDFFFKTLELTIRIEQVKRRKSFLCVVTGT